MTDQQALWLGICSAVALVMAPGPAAGAPVEGARASVRGERNGVLEVSGAPLPAGPAEVRHEGEVVGFARVEKDGAVRRVLGRTPAGAGLHPVAAPDPRVLLLAPEGHPAVGEAGALFGSGLSLAPGRAAPAPDAAILLSVPERGVRLPEAATLVLSLDAYAGLRGLEVRRHVVAKRPALRVTAVAPWMVGLEAGHELPWFGKEGEQLTQRSLPAEGLPAGARVLAVSTIDQGPMLLEEALPDGRRLVALDLESPNGKAGYDPGSKLKWLVVSLTFDRRPFYGRHFQRRLTVEEYTRALRELVERHPGRAALTEVGKGSAGDPVLSLTLGRKEGPRFVFTGVIHGGEVMNAYGLLRLAEVLLENPGKDARVSRLLERCGVEVMPLVNVWGYAKGKQVNSRDCDLNRNFDYLWQEFKGDGGWRAAYKPEVLRGAAPFSEGEAQAVRDRLLAGEVAGYIDFHQHGMEHGHLLMLPHRPVQREREALLFLQELLNARMAGRALFGSDRRLQLTISRDGTPRPFAENWAASRGIPSCTFELPGGLEESLVLTDLVVQEALHFMWVLAASRGE